jgi:hypothetical protein
MINLQNKQYLVYFIKLISIYFYNKIIFYSSDNAHIYFIQV